jgi:DNA-binding MarR family transcriptional regulator
MTETTTLRTHQITIDSPIARDPTAAAKDDKHDYFVSVAGARFVIRKAFRIVEEQAKAFGIDPLLHQALIQIHGSPTGDITVGKLAERLDIAPPFASNLLRGLTTDGLVARRRDADDQRITHISVTPKGQALLIAIDARVRAEVDAFTAQLTQAERESAISVLMFYVGLRSAPA